MSIRKFFFDYLIEFLLAFFVLVASIDNVRNLLFFENINSFVFGSVLIFFVLLLYIWFWFSHRSKNLKLNLVFDDDVNEVGVVINKIIVPIWLYFSLVYYSYYNLTSGLLNLIYFAFFVCFYIYFVNVKAFFIRELNREYRSDFVYDVFKFMIFFLSVNVVANITRDYAISEELSSILIFLITFLLVSLAIFRLTNVKLKYFLLNFPIALVISFIYLFLISFSSIDFVILSFLMLLVYYALVSLMFHKIRGNLTAGVIFEYITMILLSLSILIFI